MPAAAIAMPTVAATATAPAAAEAQTVAVTQVVVATQVAVNRVNEVATKVATTATPHLWHATATTGHHDHAATTPP